MIDIIIKMIEFMFRYDFLNFLSSEFHKKTKQEKALSWIKLNIKNKNKRTLFLAEWKLFFYWILSEFIITLNGFQH